MIMRHGVRDTTCTGTIFERSAEHGYTHGFPLAGSLLDPIGELGCEDVESEAGVFAVAVVG
jgi:hypothetical protein